MVVNERASLKMDMSDEMSSHSEEDEDTEIEDIDEDSQSSMSCNSAAAPPPSKPTSIGLFTSNSIFAGLPTPHISFDGLNSGVPTRTTPTLTPTTLRNIEQTFIELQCPDNSERHSNEARFVPPSVKAIGNPYDTTTITTAAVNNLSSTILGSNSVDNTPHIYTTTSMHNMNKSVTQWHHLGHHTSSVVVALPPEGPSSISQDCNSSDSGSSSYGAMSVNRPTPPVTPHRQPMMTPTTLDDATNASDNTSPPPSAHHYATTTTGRGRGGARRNVGGRKPQREANLSPEEEQRRELRRERNKAAAARCRKRRVDHTNLLIEEVEGLESKKRDLHNELQSMRLVKEELEMILAHHSKDGSLCKANSINTTRHNPNLNTTASTTAVIMQRRQQTDIKPPPYSASTTTNNNNIILPITTIKTEYDDYNDMDYNEDDDFSSADEYADSQRDLFPAPSNKRVMLTHASLPPVIMRPSRPNSLNVANVKQQTALPPSGATDSLAGIMNSTPSSGLQFNFDSLMVGGTGLTPVSGPLLPTSLHCGSQQQHQLRLNTTTSSGNGSVATTMAEMMAGDLNTPDVSYKFMLSL